jgi:phosphate transport system substrate-binding protein
MNTIMRTILLATASISLAAPSVTQAAVTGAGSTFVYPVLSKWAADYKRSGGTEINYQSIGSGGGIAQIKAATVDFGATDKPLSSEELAASGLAQFPVVIGGVVPVINVPGIRPGQMHLSGPVLAAIFAGEITKWNHPTIKTLNPSLRLPATAISVVHRSDGSGTTFNFTHYLSQVSKGWKAKFGEGTSVDWAGGIGGKGNEGVAAYVKQIPGSIGYVEYAYVTQNKMNYALVRNSAGRFVTPNTASFQAAAATADWSHAKDFYLVMTNAPGAKAYPITATTWVLMHRQPKNSASSADALKFFRWSLNKGQKQALSLNYVPLPAPLIKKIEDYVASNIK